MMQRYENKNHTAVTSLPPDTPVADTQRRLENSLLIRMHDRERRFAARRRTHKVLRFIFGDRYRHGVTRFVVLAGVSAYKVPRFDSGLSMFLTGWLANREEKKKWYSATHHFEARDGQALPHMRLAPVRCTYLGGLVLVMARCREVTNEHGQNWIDAEQAHARNDPDTAFDWSYWCTDLHPMNVGWYEDRMVCFDYSG